MGHGDQQIPITCMVRAERGNKNDPCLGRHAIFFRYRHRPVPSPTSGQLVQQNRGAAMLTLPLVGASSSERGFASLPRHPSRRLEEKAGHVAGSEDGARDLPAGQAIGLDRPAGRRDRLHRTERRFPGSAVRRKRTTDSWRMPPGIEIR